MMTSVAKSVITCLSTAFGSHLNRFMDYVVITIHAIQGKGFSWDISKEVTSIIPLLPQQGAVIFDVGANKGEWSRLLLDRIKDVKKIYGFEPSKYNKKHFEAFNKSNYELIQLAVGKETGEAMLYSNAPESGLASLHPRQLDFLDIRHEPQETIRVITLDEFAEERNIETIHLLKMDIEGHEFMALEGAECLFKEKRIKVLTFEFGGANIDSRTFFKDFWYLLKKYGFNLFRIMPNAKLYPILRYTEDLENFRTTNYVAILGD